LIVIKNRRELEQMREAGALLASVFEQLRPMVRPGVTTAEIDREAERLIRAGGAAPAFLGYRGFPGSICASINEEVVHGIPGARRLREGDIFGLDIGLELGGFIADSTVTLPIGEISPLARLLLSVTEQALKAGIALARPGKRVGDIGAAIEAVVKPHGFGIVRQFAGHGVGRSMHEAPSVPNYGPPGQGPLLKEGMTLAIEPMINAGGDDVVMLDDSWTVVTADGSLSAQFEHTVAVTASGPWILTEAEGVVERAAS
jgi:methionyl aminopeptidase